MRSVLLTSGRCGGTRRARSTSAGTVSPSRGRFGLDVSAGCYTVVVTAPAGRTFTRHGAVTAERQVCAVGGQTVGTLTFRLR